MRYTALVAYRTWGRIPNRPVHSRPARPLQPRPPGRFGLPKIIESSAINRCQRTSDEHKIKIKADSISKLNSDRMTMSSEIKAKDGTENKFVDAIRPIEPEIKVISKEEDTEFSEDKTKVLNVL